MTKRAKVTNVSRRERQRLPAKPEFGFTGIIAGLLVGWIAGAVIELALGKPKMLIMVATGFSGVFVGCAIEAIRFWWRLRRYRAARHPGISESSIRYKGRDEAE